MRQYIFVCDSEWKIKRLLDGESVLLRPETDLKTVISEPDKLEAVENVEQQSVMMLQLNEKSGPFTAIIHHYTQYYLIFLVQITSQKEFSAFAETYMRWTSWADENLNQLYQDEYFQIQQMNNQLINMQRSLMKTNQKLQEAVRQVREANDTIAVLEQDELTGFYRAAAFYRRCDELFEAGKTAFDMIVLDINRFKQINEVFGRKTGDVLLSRMALFLIGIPDSEQGIFARISADTFCMLMPSELRFYEKLKNELPGFVDTYPLPIRVQVRIGVYGVGEEKAAAEQICDRVRLALDLARTSGKSGIAFYDQKLHEKLIRENEILGRVDDALKNHEFQAYLQPKVDIATGKTIGAEALVRWIDPKRGMIPPNDFIPLLEQEGYVYRVDRYIWEETCRILKMRRDAGFPIVPVSVNVARGDLYEKDLLKELDRILEKYEIDSHMLHLEIIERAYVKDSEYVFQVLTKLRDRGFLIEMDDFGMGESSLSMAAGMPVDVLKLDRRFLIADLEDKRHIEVIRFIIHLAGMLEMKIIAEGVETQEQAKLLLEMGCPYAQGYYYGRPQPEAEFFEHLADFTEAT